VQAIFRNTLTPSMPAPYGLERCCFQGAPANDIPATQSKQCSPPSNLARHCENRAQWRRRRRRGREDGVARGPLQTEFRNTLTPSCRRRAALNGVVFKARPPTIYRRRKYTTVHRLVIWRVTEKYARNGVDVDAAVLLKRKKTKKRLKAEILMRAPA
jgi:hypothetical protein